jgi:hypothetical protein
VACDTLMACKTYYASTTIFLCLDDYFVYLSISYVYEMKCVVVHLYPCYIVVILCIFTICHTILSHDYTHPFSHPMFCKIVQLSSEMPFSVTFTIINPWIYLGGAPCTNLENKTLLCLIIEKNLSVCHQSSKRGRLKVHLGNTNIQKGNTNNEINFYMGYNE